MPPAGRVVEVVRGGRCCCCVDGIWMVVVSVGSERGLG